MAVVLREGSPGKVLATVEELLKVEDPFDERFDKIDLGEWSKIHVYLQQREKSVISPPYMEAFLELQKQIYQLAALAISGEADAGKLSDSERRSLEIHVKVTGGSSNLEAPLAKPLENLGKQLIGKLTKKQATILVISLAALAGTGWGLHRWLENTKAIQLEELKSKEHLAALEKITFLGKSHAETANRLIDVLEQQGEIGRRAIEAVQATNENFVKAIAKEGNAKVNGIEVDQQAAELLRTPARKKADPIPVKKVVKVVGINSADLSDLQVVLEDRDKVIYRVRLKDSLFAALDRHKLFESLENRTFFEAELSVREVDGNIRSVEFLRIADNGQQEAAR